MPRLLVIVPRDRASEYESVARCFADIPDCEVIVDRRKARRREGQNNWGGNDMRRGERRVGRLEGQGVHVLFVH